jgi:CheY-like chemotaxis protein
VEDLKNKRILIVDDTEDIHEAIKCALECNSKVTNIKFNSIISDLFDSDKNSDDEIMELPEYILDSAFQGEEAVEMVQKSFNDGNPYAVVFMDVRMPPGIDGIEALRRIWEIDREIEAIICTAYSDYNLTNLSKKLGYTHQLLLLKKPFEVEEIQQLALAQTIKWNWKMNFKKGS